MLKNLVHLIFSLHYFYFYRQNPYQGESNFDDKNKNNEEKRLNAPGF
jgi:hypothetical protein